MIQVQNLSKFYGQRKAIDELNFSVNKGEVLGFLGPNGAGKTTTMKILTCFMPASSGVAKIAGYDVFEEPLEVKKRVGYLPETPPVYREMFVEDYLIYKANLHSITGSKAKNAASSALEKCGLTHVRKRIIGNLSKGYRQRVGIAQSLVHNPDVLILDEPTVGLDPIQILEIRELIKGLAGEHTVILSTHILPEVEATCSRVLIINEGKIVAIDSLQAISARLRRDNAITLIVGKTGKDMASDLKKTFPKIAQIDVIEENGFSKIQISSSDEIDLRPEVAKYVVQSGIPLFEVKRESLSLEQVFLKLTTVESSH
jgi:ABC-2 type transport system ATP-binding protein